MTILLLVLLAQDPEALVERLRSGSPAERDEAAATLKTLGERAGPALRKAAEDADVDVSAYARRLLDRLAVDRALTPRMKKTFPGLLDRLTGSELAWAETLSFASGLTTQPGGLKNADLAPLAVRALRAPAPPETLADLARFVRGRGLREAIPGLTMLLANADADVVAAAIEALQEMEAREAVPDLIAILGTGPTSARLAALDVIETLNPLEAAPAVRVLLRDPGPAVRAAAVKVLAGLDPRDRHAALIAELLDDRDPRVREQSARSLGELRAESQRAALLRALDDPFGNVRGLAVEAFSELEPGGDAEAVLKAARKLAPRERQQAYARLAMARWPGIADALLDEVTSGTDEALRSMSLGHLHRFDVGGEEILKEAAEGLGQPRRMAILTLKVRQEPTALPILLDALDAESAEIRLAAETALGFWKDEEASRALRPLLDRDSARLRWGAVSALASRGDRSVLDRIRKGLGDPDPGIRQSALHAARLLEAPELADEVTALLADPHRACSDMAINAFRDGVFSPSETILVKQLAHDDVQVRRSALGRLWNLRSRSAIGEARRLLADPSAPVRETAADLLGSFGDRDSIPALRRLLDDADESVVVEALGSLGELDAKEAAGDVAARLRARDGLVRRAALLALEQLGNREYSDELRARLRDADDKVRSEAARIAGAWRVDGVEQDLVDLLEDSSNEVRIGALEGLRALGAKGRSSEIAARLRDLYPEVSWTAAEVLAELDVKERFADVVVLLGRVGVRSAPGGAWMLRRLLPEDGAARIRSLLDSPAEEVRCGAVAALGLLGVVDAVPALVRAAREDPSSSVNAEAIRALGRIGGPTARLALLEILDAPDPHRPWLAMHELDDEGAVAAEPRLRRFLAQRRLVVDTLAVLARARSEGVAQRCKAALADDTLPGWRSETLVESLVRVGTPEAVAVLRGWRVPRFHQSARLERARGLCRLGQGDEVDLIVRSTVDLSVLNAVRTPEAWAALRDRRWDGERLLTEREMIERSTAQLGWGMEGAERAGTSRMLIRPGTSLLELLESTGVPWVAEKGVLKLLRRGEAEDFWEAWAAARKKQ